MTSKKMHSTVEAHKRKLRKDVANAEAHYQDAASQYQELRLKFKGNGHNLERVFAQLRELGTAVGELKDDMARLDRLNPDDFITQAQLEAALDSHRASVDIHKANADKQWAELRSTVDEHSTSIHMLQEGQSSLNTRVDKLQKEVKRTAGTTGGDNNRLFTLIALVLAIVAGVIAAIAWSNNTFRDILKIPYSGDLQFNYSWANSPLAALLCGCCVGLAVLAILLLIVSFLPSGGSRRATSTKSTTTTTTRSHSAAPATTPQPVAAKRGGR